MRTIRQEYKHQTEHDKTDSVCMVIPTYNEASNIKELLALIYDTEKSAQYEKENIIMNVLFVDDNSPDGTSDVVKRYQKENPHIYLLQRSEKNGLGAAYVAGMEHAMQLLHPDIIFEMDADLSHDPMYIMPMIDEIRSGADFVIGSRYVTGGAIPENWGVKRKMTSKLANVYAKTLLRIKNVNDCTGGFRAIRTSALAQIDLHKLNTKGYAFQISLLEQMRKNNFLITEVPIHFKDRVNGESKMRIADIAGVGYFVLITSLMNIFMPSKQQVEKRERPLDIAPSVNQRRYNPHQRDITDDWLRSDRNSVIDVTDNRMESFTSKNENEVAINT